LIEKLSPEAAAESLTGFDEIAIEQMFRKDISDMSGTMSMRAIMFVLQRRDGQSDADAFRAVMAAPLKEIQAGFAEVDEGKAGENDETEPGPTSS
jgi:hypothetical protein